ncbi:extracellular endoglucanase [Grosmannia clavigera kw1407]|uniref:cellulase n=1 Tax=Grosmannia clavigera (strain kw1407 / UAMH 11150) TaxID=655863 RepID=F0XAP1_GROCL|nr:extracellular endoglucanase [Grosmannia clavigera kw1407]EFX05328.1 extracellular endoglucanase [Grosmannia clavigera kw1407]
MHLLEQLLGVLAVSLTLPLPTSAMLMHSESEQKRNSSFRFTGVSESGAEFGSGKIPGTVNTDYVWPVSSSIDTLMEKGFNTFRVPILMERAIPTQMSGTIDESYFQNLEKIITYITGKGAYAVIDPHNFGRYNGNIISNVAAFEAWWYTVAKRFHTNSKVIFDTNNEYHDMDNNLVASLNQAAIKGIRASGATTQYIFVEGNMWSGAWHWISSGTSTGMGTLVDPSNKIIYEMHQYLDTDGSGTSTDCVSATVGSERLAAATKWLKDNKKIGILGETAGGANSQCISALQDMFRYMEKNTDVWAGWLWWGAGPWWGPYIYSMEPPSGVAYTGVLPSITQFI